MIVIYILCIVRTTPRAKKKNKVPKKEKKV